MSNDSSKHHTPKQQPTRKAIGRSTLRVPASPVAPIALLSSLSSQAPPNASETKVQPRWGVGMHPILAVLTVVVLYFVTQFAAVIFLGAILAGFGWSSQQVEDWLFNVVSGQFVYMLVAEGLVLSSIFTYLRFRGIAFANIGWTRVHWKHLGYALLGFVVYLIMYFLMLVAVKMLVPLLDLEQKQDIGGFDNASSSLDLVLTAVSLVVLPPLAEEVLFRGFLYTGLRRGVSFWPAAVVTSIVFGIGHLQFGSEAPLLWVAALDTFTLSMVLCFIREHTKSLWPGIAIHAFKNAVAFSVLFIFT